MQEQQRRQYLQAMGIPVWIPRHELPFAAPSVLLKAETEAHEQRVAVDEFSIQSRLQGHAQVVAALAGVEGATSSGGSLRTPAQPPQTPSPQIPSQQPSQAAASDARQAVSLGDGPVAGSAIEKDVLTETTLTETTPVVDMTPPRFELHFVLTGHVAWVCDQAVDARRMAFFAARVASAMSYPQATLTPVCFRWPFIDNPREDQSMAVARQALAAQWAFFEHHGGQALVAFGGQAGRWGSGLTARHRVFEQGLDAVLTSADLKRDVWLQLKDWHPTAFGD